MQYLQGENPRPPTRQEALVRLWEQFATRDLDLTNARIEVTRLGKELESARSGLREAENAWQHASTELAKLMMSEAPQAMVKQSMEEQANRAVNMAAVDKAIRDIDERVFRDKPIPGA